MSILVLIGNIALPLIMIIIGVLYKLKSYKVINTTVDLLTPLPQIFSDFYDNNINGLSSKDLDSQYNRNRTCSLIWIFSGIFTLIAVIILLVLPTPNLYSVSISLLESEFAIFILLVVSIEFVFKNIYCKKIA